MPRSLRGFWTYWTAATIGSFGAQVTAVAVSVLAVTVLHATAAETGVVRAAQFLPYAVFGLLVGVLVDRVRRKPLLVWSGLLRGVALLAIPALWAAEALGVWSLVAVLFAYGTLSVVVYAAQQSILVHLVPRSDLLRANARIDQGDTVAQTSGPALAGLLLAWMSAPVAILVDAVAHLATALLTTRVHAAETAIVTSTGSTTGRLLAGLISDIGAGLRWVYTHRTLAPLACSTHVWFLANSMATTVFLPFALRPLGLTGLTYGVVLAVGGVGGLVGATLSIPLGRRGGPGRMVLVGHLTTAAAWAIVALTPVGSLSVVLVMVGGAQLLLGTGMSLDNANSLSYRQALTPDHLQGRTNATMRSANRSVAVVGSLVGGVLADAVGYRPALWVAVAVLGVAVAIIAVSPMRTARHDAPAPASLRG